MIQSRGFTLIELLLSVSILGIITAVSIPVYASFLTRNDLGTSVESVSSAMRRAGMYARGMNDDSAWGIKVQSSSITLFKGTSFATRETAYDEVITLPGTITASGMDEIIFAKLAATPSATGTITLTTNTNETKAIAINAKGMVTN